MIRFSALWWLGVCLAAVPLLGAQATARVRSPERLALQRPERLALQQPPQAPAAPQQDMAHPQNTNAGIYAFTSHCAGCHDTGKEGASDRHALNRHTPEQVLASITTGSMAQYATAMTDFEKRVVAVYVGGRPLGAAASGDASQMKNRCVSRPAFEPSKGSEWNGWGFDRGNSRFQTSPGLTAAEAPKLALKWAFGFPSGNSAYGQPAVVGGRVFVGGDTGFVYGARRRERVRVLVVPRDGRRAHRDHHRPRARGEPFPRAFSAT